MTNYLHFISKIDFDKWHEEVKKALGLPHVGRNAATGKLQPDKQQTVNYTDPLVHPKGNRSGVICTLDNDCPSKFRNKTAEAKYKMTRETPATLELED